MKEGAESSNDKELAEKLSKEADRLKTLLNKQLIEYKDFCKENGLRTLEERLYVGNKLRLNEGLNINHDVIKKLNVDLHNKADDVTEEYVAV